MKMNFKDIFRLPLEGKLSPKVTDEVENTINEKHLIRRTSSATFPSRGRLDEKGSRRGFTIVELAMALAIIVIVTAVSIGVVAVDSKTHGETIDMVEATNIAENAIECFRYAVNNDVIVVSDEETITEISGKFEYLFRKTIELKSQSDFSFNGENGSYTVEFGDVIIEITLSDSNTEDLASFDTIHIIGNNSEGELFKPATYTVR